jgi:hypothetical protein
MKGVFFDQHLVAQERGRRMNRGQLQGPLGNGPCAKTNAKDSADAAACGCGIGGWGLRHDAASE